MDNTVNVNIIVARYKEDLSWLMNLLKKHPNFHATVMNDGPQLTVPQDVLPQMTIVAGDKVPHEASKYAQYIIDNWNDITNNSNEYYVFLQGDPIYHNPTLMQCFEHVEKWNPDYQNLTLYAHPPPWGCAHAILNKTAPGITNFAEDARVWNDTMDRDLQGIFFTDPFWRDFKKDLQIDVPYIEHLFQFRAPSQLQKCYAACFAITAKSIKRTPLTLWKNIHIFLLEGCERTKHISSKSRAVIMEYIWAVIFNKDTLFL